MKTWKICACLLALLSAVPAVRADDGDKGYSVFNLGLGAQYWMAKDIDGDNGFDSDGMWGGNIIFRIRPIKYLGIDLRAGASANWEGETYWIDGRRYKEDETFSCVPLEVGLVLMMPLGSVVTLYGGGGAGYYIYDYNEKSYSSRHGHHYRKEYDEDTDLENDVGWYGLAGLSFQLCPHLSIFGEARYTGTETKLKDFHEVKLDCSGAAFQAGVIFDF
jgi:opacity protein-like surface antigen